ncbi:hypothetical protein F5X97DRAFT_172700 [Nemania serpens]|nr:hypothetical protein F5X97DRAFT_172700 [Nemania serpens]
MIAQHKRRRKIPSGQLLFILIIAHRHSFHLVLLTINIQGTKGPAHHSHIELVAKPPRSLPHTTPRTTVADIIIHQYHHNSRTSWVYSTVYTTVHSLHYNCVHENRSCAAGTFYYNNKNQTQKTQYATQQALPGRWDHP